MRWNKSLWISEETSHVPWGDSRRLIERSENKTRTECKIRGWDVKKDGKRRFQLVICGFLRDNKPSVQRLVIPLECLPEDKLPPPLLLTPEVHYSIALQSMSGCKPVYHRCTNLQALRWTKVRVHLKLLASPVSVYYITYTVNVVWSLRNTHTQVRHVCHYILCAYIQPVLEIWQ